VIGAGIAPLSSAFSLREPLRQGRLFAMLDATGFDALADLLEASGLDHGSLFLGEDAVMLRGEAPFIVALTTRHLSAVKEILRRANNRHAGFLCIVGEGDEPPGIDQLRRHWKKWLSVRIPDEEGLVLFRFFDARIMFAFVATLPASDAAAFFGPNQALIGFRGQSLMEVRQVIPAKPRRVGAGAWYEMTPVQVDAFSEVAGDAFADKFRRYMREVWWDKFENASDETLDKMREDAMATARRLDLPLTANTIVTLALIEVNAPQVIGKAHYIMEQVDKQIKVHPNGYAVVMMAVAVTEVGGEAGARMEARSAYWDSFK